VIALLPPAPDSDSSTAPVAVPTTVLKASPVFAFDPVSVFEPVFVPVFEPAPVATTTTPPVVVAVL
jgi:hypothetical protein